MIHYYVSEENTLQEIETPRAGCWISLIKPSEQEIAQVKNAYPIEENFLRAALDLDERSRIDSDEGCTMILVNIPFLNDSDDTELYDTIPFSIIMMDNAVITVCSQDTAVIDSFLHGRVRGFRTQMKSRFILQLLYQVDTLYLQYLRNIDRRSDEVEDKLQKSTHNSELIELLRLEKSLVYFTTALRSNEVVLERLIRMQLITQYPDDAELLDDVVVENKQAIEMTNIYSGILSGMMDAFASVISNNLNIVMKVLAIVTIIMSVPTIIFSAYGMNVNMGSLPFGQDPNGFIIILGITVVLSILATLFFTKTNLFK